MGGLTPVTVTGVTDSRRAAGHQDSRLDASHGDDNAISTSIASWVLRRLIPVGRQDIKVLFLNRAPATLDYRPYDLVVVPV